MTQTKPLLIWRREGEQVDLEAIKTAKASLDLPFLVVPRYVPEPMLTRSPEIRGQRVLAIGTQPPWVCDYFLVAPNASEYEWRSALAWVLSDDEDWEATTSFDIMNSIFGPGTREISPEELAAEEKMIDYIQRRA